jgi:outer membrane putative beta-barrel porin/alpha-amylase
VRRGRPSLARELLLRSFRRGLAVALLTIPTTISAQAESCPKPADEIATDRPDVTNSSIVVPVGSLQNENGVNLSGRDGGRTLDGTNSRWRLGIAPCLEVLVDVPTYFANLKQPGSSGFSDVAPALKWQISPAPGKFDLSMTVGAALPTGAAAIAGRGVQPYLQFPWSLELHEGWGLSGMFTEFFRPSDATRRITETTFVVERKLTPNFALFTEYVGDYPEGETPSVMLNSGGVYHLTKTQQLDFHVAFGLNHKAPTYIAGVGYSFRIDGLFH